MPTMTDEQRLQFLTDKAEFFRLAKMQQAENTLEASACQKQVDTYTNIASRLRELTRDQRRAPAPSTMTVEERFRNQAGNIVEHVWKKRKNNDDIASRYLTDMLVESISAALQVAYDTSYEKELRYIADDNVPDNPKHEYHSQTIREYAKSCLARTALGEKA